ncbi:MULTISPECIES: hypothetical protein [unclassified Pseudomonas]|jgi:hypothetical protein|uniref:hypothetical protein n=1 Tax=unclassified Pseudomonas TaxID=196821 RepID=UPI000C87B616|nr:MULTISPECIES: hypothetical protein [unclassified Pseudomonas]PMU87107.1 hypothetical protein C1Y30_23415 [Pseudomonas sp. GW704-F3]PMU91437.1 hypothetical protein C1Y28_23225 [Pseudomonas sp. GW704-F5]PMV01237.1 hypothetical protein C1Y29_20185 [Pseudomonas sp. MPBD4-3]PMV25781.1 hypothetical protein C1Y27_23810 [Pseudomonas sp. GW704-F2]
MPTSYADSAQARESDRRWDLPNFGKQQHADLFHEYTAEDLAGREEHRLKERASLKLRIGLAMAQMEAICPPAGGDQ